MSTATPNQAALRYQKISELFSESCQLESSAQQAFLDDACGSDVDLKQDVLRLLAADRPLHAPSDSLLNLVDQVGVVYEQPATCPKQIGNYRIVRKIDEGGMGTVYEAVRTSDYEQRVAIKLLKRGDQLEELVRRFRDEVRFLAVLGEHQNIAGLLDAGTTDEGIPYLVMQYVAGQRIDKYCDEHRLTIGERITLFLEACSAVQFAHQHTVIHRDLKPSNILVTPDRTCQLIDFGIAKLLNPEPRFQAPVQTRTLYRILTPEYASPEQARGQQLTTASDVYSLGVVLYELLTGHRPYENATTGTANAAGVLETQEPLKPSSVVKRQSTIQTSAGEKRISPESVSLNRSGTLRRLRHELVGDLDKIVLMALRKEPDRRYGSAEQLASDLRRHLNGLPVVAREDTLRYRCTKFVRRNRVAAGAVVLVTLSLIAGVIGVAVQRNRAKQSAAEARWEQYRANIAAAISDLKGGNTASVRRLLEKSPSEYRNWEWAHVQSQQDMSVRFLPGPKHNSSDVAFSPNGYRLATISAEHTVQVWDVATLKPVAVLKGHEEEIWELEFNADGTRLATASADRTVRLWDATSGTQIALLAEFGHPDVTFSPDGKLVAAAGLDNSVRLWNASDGTPFSVLSGHNNEVHRVAFSPDSKRLASGSSDQTVRLWEVAGGEELAVFRGHTGGVRNLAFSPDGLRLASGGYYPDSTVRLWDVVSGEEITVLTGHHNTICALSFNATGDRIVSSSADQTARLWDGQTGAPLAVLRGHRGAVRDVWYAPGGTQIATASADSTIRLWDALSGNLISVLRGHTGSIDALAFNSGAMKRTWNPATAKPTTATGAHDSVANSVAFNAHTSLMASSANDGSVRLWNMRPGLRDGVLRGHEDFVYGVDVSPDDSQIASVAWDGTLRIWDLATRYRLHYLDGGVSGYSTVAYSSDGKHVACGTNERTVHLWDLASEEKRVFGTPRSEWYPHTAPIAFSPDGLSIATLDADNHLCLWNVKTEEKQVINLSDLGIASALTFSPNGRQLIIGTRNNRLLRWDVAEKRVREVPLPDGTQTQVIAFSLDSSWLVLGGQGNQMHVLEPATWKKVSVLSSPSYVGAIAFCAGNKRIAVGCQDNVIRIWDTETWQIVAELTGHEDYVRALAFTHDGTRLVSGSGDFTVRIWDTEPLRNR